jgi:hypothetical protein
VKPSDTVYEKGIRFLLKSQLDDGAGVSGAMTEQPGTR